MKAGHDPLGLKGHQLYNTEFSSCYSSRQTEASVALTVHILEDARATSGAIEAAIGVSSCNEMTGTWVI